MFIPTDLLVVWIQAKPRQFYRSVQFKDSIRRRTMDDCKIFSKIHEAYEGNFQALNFFGVFGIENPTRKRKFWTAFKFGAIFFYPIIYRIFSATNRL
jgi:hypothetical protein